MVCIQLCQCRAKQPQTIGKHLGEAVLHKNLFTDKNVLDLSWSRGHHWPIPVPEPRR